MFGRGEPVPFAFVAQADQFRSNVTPPPRERPGAVRVAGRVLATVAVLAGLVGAVALGMPALDPQHSGGSGRQQAEIATHR